jgi:hypothetical protein
MLMQSDNQPSDTNWTFHNEEGGSNHEQPAEQAPTEQKQTEPVSWTASEFIDHHKDAGWYLSLAGAVLLLCGLVFLFTKDITSVVAIAIVIVLYVIITSSKPRQRSYTMTEQGISIDEKFYPFDSFKSFTLSQQGAVGCVTFLPLKRLLPELEIYFALTDAEPIVGLLSGSLPNDQRKDRAIDRIIQKLHL